MCSCSGNCNCNSSTIPRGPQGPQGPAATITVGDVTPLPSGSNPTVTNTGTSGAATFNFGIPAGAPGTNGTPGINGINAYTTTSDEFIQPAIGGTVVAEVADNSWVIVNQIVFIGNPTGTNVGGYYKVTAKSTVSGIDFITLERLNWTIPGVTFITTSNGVPAVSLVQSSGTIGATGAAGANGNGITIIKSIINTLSSTTSTLAPGPFTLTTATSPVNFVFKSIDLCPNDGDVGRITYEVVFNKQFASSDSANISLDIDFGVSGTIPTLPRMEPYEDTNTLEENNKLTNLTWSPTTTISYMYVKYIIDIQRRGNTLSNIFVNWTASSASVKASGSYHNITAITNLDFSDINQFLEISIKGFNNTTSTGILARNSRLYVESLRQLQP